MRLHCDIHSDCDGTLNECLPTNTLFPPLKYNFDAQNGFSWMLNVLISEINRKRRKSRFTKVSIDFAVKALENIFLSWRSCRGMNENQQPNLSLWRCGLATVCVDVNAWRAYMLFIPFSAAVQTNAMILILGLTRCDASSKNLKWKSIVKHKQRSQAPSWRERETSRMNFM